MWRRRRLTLAQLGLWRVLHVGEQLQQVAPHGGVDVGGVAAGEAPHQADGQRADGARLVVERDEDGAQHVGLHMHARMWRGQRWGSGWPGARSEPCILPALSARVRRGEELSAKVKVDRERKA